MASSTKTNTLVIHKYKYEYILIRAEYESKYYSHEYLFAKKYQLKIDDRPQYNSPARQCCRFIAASKVFLGRLMG